MFSYVEGRERKRSREAEIETKKSEMEQVKVTLEEKRVIKDAAEAPEKEALNKIKEEEERLRKLREEEEKLEREKEALVSLKSNFVSTERDVLNRINSYSCFEI